MKKKPIIAGNWKMNKTPTDGGSFVDRTVNLLLDIKYVSVIFAPPFTGLFDMDVKPPFYSAAQNCHWEDSGAFTGEISVPMIRDCGAEYVILGHSERRHVFGESDDWVNRKVKAVLTGGLTPILCIGETLEQRDAGQTDLVLKSQLELGLKDVAELDHCVIAYEPVWAIGTGLTADSEQVELAHKVLMEILAVLYPGLSNFHVLYGGSVKPDNAGALIRVPGVDGFLIGGASLDLESFTSIIRTVDAVQEKIL
jgi:triosephosphate isomerase